MRSPDRINPIEVVARVLEEFSNHAPTWWEFKEVLGIIGRAIAVDRVYVFENGFDPVSGELTASQRAEWCAGGISAEIDNPVMQNMAYSSIGERWLENLSSGKALQIKASGFTEQEQAIMGPQGIRSMLVVPLTVGATWWGVIGFDQCSHEREWDADTVRMLTVTGSLIASQLERQRLQMNLERAEKRSRLAMQVTGVGVWDCDLETRDMFIAAELKDALGFAEEEIPNRIEGWLERIHPEDEKRVREAVDDFIAHKAKSFEVEHRMITKSGFPRWYLARGSAIRDSNGKAIRLIGTSTDITERKLSELANAESRQLLEAIFETSTSALFLFDEETRKSVDCNSRAVSLFNAPDKGVLIATGGADLAPGVFSARRLARIVLTTRNRGHWSAELEMRKFDGSGFWGLVAATKLPLPGRSLILVSIAETTERKRAEIALRQSEAAFRAVFEGSPDGMMVIEFNDSGEPWMILDCNGRAAGMHGYERAELLGGSRQNLLVERLDPAIADATLAQVRAEGVLRGEAIHVRKDGSTFWAEYQATILNIEGRERMLIIETDVTERKQHDEERLRASKLEALGLLAGGIAHDFNNVLTAITGNLSLIKMDLPKDTPVKDYLDAMEQAGIRAQELAAQLLTFARGGAPILRITSLAEVIRSTTRFSTRGSRCRVDIEVADDVPQVEADEGQISQVLQNLLINADQAMPDGGTIKVRLDQVEENDPVEQRSLCWLRLRVRDNGPGIPQELRERIFDPYFSTKPQGSGLGLATVYSIIRQHRGSITVFSEMGNGTEFTILLPATSRASDVEVLLEKEVLAGHGRILVMDDEEVIRTLAKRGLGRFGYDVVAVKDGEEAIKAFKEAALRHMPFDAVVLDMVIPGGLGGEKTLERLLAIEPNIRGLAMSGYSKSGVIGNPAAFGFKGGLAKPFTLEQFAQALGGVLAT